MDLQASHSVPTSGFNFRVTPNPPSSDLGPVIGNVDLSYLATFDIFPRWFPEHSHQRE